MFIDSNPFPYLERDQYAGTGNGNIVFLDDSIPDEKKDWLRQEYKKWWDKREEERFAKGIG